MCNFDVDIWKDDLKIQKDVMLYLLQQEFFLYLKNSLKYKNSSPDKLVVSGITNNFRNKLFMSNNVIEIACLLHDFIVCSIDKF